MTCEELYELIPDMVDGSLSIELLAEALAILPGCPDCANELEIARQVRDFVIRLEAANLNLKVPAGFEARLLNRVRQQTSGQDLLDLLSQSLGEWLLEIVNLLGNLTVPTASPALKAAR